MPPFSRQNLGLASKALLSVWLVYHLFCILILPNGGSFLGRYSEKYILEYGNFLGINTPWNLFSPDPAHTMYFASTIHFEGEDGQEVKPPLDTFFPPEKTTTVTDSSQR